MYDVSYGQEVLIGPNKGSSEQVKEWQSYLVKKGYNIGRWCIDGDFGSATQSATRALGRDLDVETGGAVTMELWNAASGDEAIFMADVTAAQKDAGCPGWRGPSSTDVATTEKSAPAAPGVIGKVAEVAFTPRGLLVGGLMLMVGVGLYDIVQEHL